MGFFSTITDAIGGALKGGGQDVQQTPTTQAFDIDLGQFGRGGREEGGPIQSQLGEVFSPFLQQAQQQGLGRDIEVGRAAQAVPGTLLSQGQRAFQGADLLQREALAQTPEAEFNALQALLAPGQERQRGALESRLFAQGRLGTTGGSQAQAAQEQAFEQNRLASAVQAITGARQARGQARSQANQALQTALGLTQAGLGGQVGLADREQGIQQQSLQNILGLQQAQLAPLNVGGALSGAQTALTSRAPGILNQALGAFAGQAGKALAAKAGV